MKRIIEGVLATSLIVLCMSCNNGEASTQANQTSKVTRTENSFACPMHPEITGKEGDKCPKCGMTMVQQKTTAHSNLYHMQFASSPNPILPDKEVTLSLTPQKKDATNATVMLDTEHEKKIHLILVSDDLSWFDHIHPEPTANGSYSVKAKFPAPGHYLAFADYKPTGGEHLVDKTELQVQGDAPQAKSFISEKLSGSSGSYSFSLTPKGGQFVTASNSQMEGVIKKDGQVVDVNTLADYLGAKAHIVVISLNEKEYLHVHPEVVDGKFDIHTAFKKPGIYRGWIQFNGIDKLHTIDFTINVKPGSESVAKDAGESDGAESHNHAHHNH